MAAARHRDHEAGQIRLQLVQHGGRRSAAHGRVAARHQDHQLALREQAGAVVGTARAVARPARLRQRGQRAALDGACAALGQRQDARAPVALLRSLRTRPHQDGGRAVAQVAAQLGGPGHDVLAVSDPAPEQVLDEVADGCLGRSLGRARALELEPDQVAHEPQQRGGRRLAAGPVAQRPNVGVGHTQVDGLGPGLAGHHGPLVLGRRARHGQHAAAPVEHDHARLERPAGRARDGGQAGARLDRVRDLVEGLEEGALSRGHQL